MVELTKQARAELEMFAALTVAEGVMLLSAMSRSSGTPGSRSGYTTQALPVQARIGQARE